jgi:hypothetical protein
MESSRRIGVDMMTADTCVSNAAGHKSQAWYLVVPSSQWPMAGIYRPLLATRTQAAIDIGLSQH